MYILFFDQKYIKFMSGIITDTILTYWFTCRQIWQEWWSICRFKNLTSNTYAPIITSIDHE